MMHKKSKSKHFLKLEEAGDVQEGCDLYVAHDFMYHNQYFDGDRNSFLVAMDDTHNEIPHHLIDVKYSYVDGDTMISQSLI